MDKNKRSSGFLSFKIGSNKEKKDKKQHATLPANTRLPSTGEEAGFTSNTNASGPTPSEAIGRMSDTDVLEEFEKMLNNMNLSEEKKAPLRAREMAYKRTMLVMQYKVPATQSSGPLQPQNIVHDSLEPLQ